jgi:hypothetical protein
VQQAQTITIRKASARTAHLAVGLVVIDRSREPIFGRKGGANAPICLPGQRSQLVWEAGVWVKEVGRMTRAVLNAVLYVSNIVRRS